MTTLVNRRAIMLPPVNHSSTLPIDPMDGVYLVTEMAPPHNKRNRSEALAPPPADNVDGSTEVYTISKANTVGHTNEPAVSH